MGATIYYPEKMYTYIKGYATGAGMKETLKALSFAREKHSGQKRKDGQPYIVHPLTMACNAVGMGIRDDAVVATILLHDVPEREAAMVMAVVAHQLGKPLNQLRFKSIREVKDK